MNICHEHQLLISCSRYMLRGNVAADVGEVVQIEIEPRCGAQRAKRRRQEVQHSRREIRRRVAMGPVIAGQEADDGGRRGRATYHGCATLGR